MPADERVRRLHSWLANQENKTRDKAEDCPTGQAGALDAERFLSEADGLREALEMVEAIWPEVRAPGG